MPEYLAPGVYVEEVDTGAKPLEGVSTSTAGMVGLTERGPVNVPTLVTGWADFQRQFGGLLPLRLYQTATGYLPYAVKGFFDNGGKRLYIVRVLPDGSPGATTARLTLFDRGDTTVTWQVETASRAVAGDGLLVVTRDPAAQEDDFFLVNDPVFPEYRQLRGAAWALGSPSRQAWPAATPVTGYTLAPQGSARQLTAAAAAGATAIFLDDVSGLTAGGGDLLLIGSGLTQELVLTAAAPASNTDPVTLRHGLAFAQATGAAVQGQQATAVGTTTLLHDLPAGSRLLGLADPESLGGAPVVGMGPEPVAAYYRAQAPELVAAALPLPAAYPAGTGAATPSLTVDNTARALTVAAAAGDETVTLDNRDGLVVGGLLRFSHGGVDEYAVIAELVPPPAAAPDPGPVRLRRPLGRAYPTTATVRAVTDAAADADPTFLVRTAIAGETALALFDGSGHTPGTVLRLGAGGSPEAVYLQLGSRELTFFSLDRPLELAHQVGVSVAGRAPLMEVEALDPGTWGNNLRLAVADDTPLLDTRPTAAAAAGDPTVTLASVVGLEPGSILEFYRLVGGRPQPVFRQKVEAVLPGNRVSFGPGNLAQAVTLDLRARTREFRLMIDYLGINPRTQQEAVIPQLGEVLRHLSLDPRHSRYVVRVAGPIPGPGIPRRPDGRTEGESQRIRVRDYLDENTAIATLRLGPDLLTEDTPRGRQPRGRRLTGGDDRLAEVGDATFIGTDAVDPPQRTGLFALKNIPEISLVAIPGRTSQTVQQELISHCELLRYRFAVLDSQPNLTLAGVQEQRSLYDSKYAALYYPWLRQSDPFPDNPRSPGQISIPPSGHILGIYARSDLERGVHKAPANEVIRNIEDLEQKLTKEEQDLLNPRHINVLRNFRDLNRGLRVWGARTISSDPDWRYINVRRLFIFIAATIDRGTQWVVFEPNDQFLWERVKRTITAFLTTVWRNGALMGQTPEEAFYVKVDRTTMTQDDIDNGRLIIQVGLAPVKPAEFVIFRLGQWAGGSELLEE